MNSEHINLLLKQGRFEMAYQEAKKSLHLYPEDEEIRWLLAVSCVCLEKFPEAQALLGYLEINSNEKSRIFYLKSSIALMEDELDEAFDCIEKAIQIEPFTAVYFYQRAKVLWFLGYPEKAEIDIRRSLDMDPEDVSSYTLLAGILKSNKRYAQAAELIQDGLELNPENEYLLAELAYTEYDAGRRELAEELFEEALQINPNEAYFQEGYRLSLKSKFNIYYRLSRRMRQIQERVGSFQGIYIAYLLLLLMAGSSIYMGSVVEVNWALKVVLFIIVAFVVALVYLEPVMDIVAMRNPDYYKTMSSSETDFVKLTATLLVVGLSLFLCYFLMGISLFVSIATPIVCLPFFVKAFMVPKQQKGVWSAFALLSFLTLSSFSVFKVMDGGAIFNGAFIWLIILLTIHLWVRKIYA